MTDFYDTVNHISATRTNKTQRNHGRLSGNLRKWESKFEIVMLGSIHITVLWNTARFILKTDGGGSSAELVQYLSTKPLCIIFQKTELWKQSLAEGVFSKRKIRQRKRIKKARARDRTNKNEDAVIITVDDSCGIMWELNISNRTSVFYTIVLL